MLRILTSMFGPSGIQAPMSALKEVGKIFPWGGYEISDPRTGNILCRVQLIVQSWPGNGSSGRLLGAAAKATFVASALEALNSIRVSIADVSELLEEQSPLKTQIRSMLGDMIRMMTTLEKVRFPLNVLRFQ